MYILVYIQKLNLNFIIDEIKIKYIYIFITKRQKSFYNFCLEIKKIKDILHEIQIKYIYSKQRLIALVIKYLNKKQF